MPENVYFNPGCALSIYKPASEEALLRYLQESRGPVTLHKTCCKHEPQVPKGSLIINVCAGCDKRFSSLYDGVTTISLWEILDGSSTFPFPDHSGLTVSIQDACPIRGKPHIHDAVRNLLRRMKIRVKEAQRHRSGSVCCGDDYYPALPVATVNEKMRNRAASMPCDDVCVYCVACIKAMHIGGKKPRYLIDLLFGEPTDPQIYDTVQWHRQLDEYREKH